MNRKANRRGFSTVVRLVALAALALLLRHERAPSLAAPPVWEPVGLAAGSANVYASQTTIDTYNYEAYLSTQTNATYNITYPRLNWDAYDAHKQKAPRTYDTVITENDWLKLTIIPSLGGRVYSCEFKPTGSNAFYSNPVIKPTRWGPPEQGWWLAAGGLEWCLPVDEHGYEWGVPWQATMHARTDGVEVVLTDTGSADRLRARVTLFLPHDGGYFAITPRVENPTGEGISFKYWTNALVAPGPANTLSADFRFVLPIDQVTVHSTGDSRLPAPGQAMNWPLYKGFDWSRLSTWNEWLGFFARPQAARGFQGAYDTAADEGLVRVFPPAEAKGAKGFAWGWDNRYPSEWTDGSATYYAELHGGIAPTFWDTTYLPPGGSVEWTETWYPLSGIGGLSAATADAALHLAVDEVQATVGVQPTKPQPQGFVALCRRGDAAPLHRALVDLSPALPYRTTITPGGDLADLVLVYLDSGDNVLATTDDAPWPAADRRPPTARVGDLPPYVTSPAELAVTWSGTDAESCLLHYDVQVKDGHDGLWTDWLTHTTSTEEIYPPAEPGHTYFFRCRATDGFGNVGSFGGDEWGQAFSSLLPSPAPVLVTSRKWADKMAATSADILTYTLSLHNTGSAPAVQVWLTDTLPVEVTPVTATLAASDGGTVTCTGPAIHWKGDVHAGQAVTVTYSAQVRPEVVMDLHRVTNTMVLTHDGTTLSRQASFLLGHTRFLPLVDHGGTP